MLPDMTALADLIAPLNREVAVPGTFANVYPGTSDGDLLGALADAFSAAQIDGFFLRQSLVGSSGVVEPELSPAGGALIVTYAGERMVNAQILNLRSRVAYEAGSVKYEVEASASVLVQLLKNIAERRRRLQQLADGVAYGGTGMFMVDMYADRAYPWASAITGDGSVMMYDYELVGR